MFRQKIVNFFVKIFVNFFYQNLRSFVFCQNNYSFILVLSKYQFPLFPSLETMKKTKTA